MKDLSAETSAILFPKMYAIGLRVINVAQVYLKNGWAWVKKSIIQRSQVGHNIYSTETWITHANTKTKSVFIVISVNALTTDAESDDALC